MYDSFTVLENRHVAALPAGHRLARTRKLCLRDLAGESFVQFSQQLWADRVDAVVQKCAAAGSLCRSFKKRSGYLPAFVVGPGGVGLLRLGA